MSAPIEWNGQVVALLVRGEDGDYLVPPIVFDDRDNVVMGAEVLAAVVESGTTIEHPVICDCTPGQVAELEQFLASEKKRLGVKGYIL